MPNPDQTLPHRNIVPLDDDTAPPSGWVLELTDPQTGRLYRYMPTPLTLLGFREPRPGVMRLLYPGPDLHHLLLEELASDEQGSIGYEQLVEKWAGMDNPVILQNRESTHPPLTRLGGYDVQGRQIVLDFVAGLPTVLVLLWHNVPWSTYLNTDLPEDLQAVVREEFPDLVAELQGWADLHFPTRQSPERG